jgi:hypothetical protein
LTSLTSLGYYGPTQQAEAFRKEATEAIDAELKKLNSIFDQDIPDLNNMVRKSQVDAIMLKSDSE